MNVLVPDKNITTFKSKCQGGKLKKFQKSGKNGQVCEIRTHFMRLKPQNNIEICRR
jgi:hypothetical protein